MEININSIEITSHFKQAYKNVAEVVILNYGIETIQVIHKNVVFDIPGTSLVNGTAVPSMPFVISCFGLRINSVEIEIKFPSTRGRAVINTSIINNDKC